MYDISVLAYGVAEVPAAANSAGQLHGGHGDESAEAAEAEGSNAAENEAHDTPQTGGILLLLLVRARPAV